MEMHDADPGFYSDDNTVPEDSSGVRWGALFSEACQKMNHRIPAPTEYKTLMEEAGFVDVHLKILRRPTNTWPKDKGMKRIGLVSIICPLLMTLRLTRPSQYTLTNHLNGLHAFTIGLFTRALGWTAPEVEVFLAKCRTEWSDTSIHAYQKVYAMFPPPIYDSLS